MYCNYSKNRFGSELTFIIPSWSKASEGNYGTLREALEVQFDKYDENIFEVEFLSELLNIESRYMNIINAGYSPQQARQVLPNALKTEVVMTGFISDWEHFFELRTSIIAATGKPHPDMSALIDPLYETFVKEGYMEPLH